MAFERQESSRHEAPDSASEAAKIGASSRVHDLGHAADHAPTKIGARSLTEQLPIQAKATMAPPSGAAAAPTGAGAPLQDDVRSSMESSFGADFRSVRVHEGGNAAAFGASAYAQGENIHFQPGAYNPGSHAGRELIGHELAHVVQQREGRVAMPQGKGDPINADPGLEAEADAQGARAARGEPAGGSGSAGGAASAGGAVQRKVVFAGAPEATTEQIHTALGELGVLADIQAIYNEVLTGKPTQLVAKAKGLNVGDATIQRQVIDAWRTGPGTHDYARSAPDGKRLLQDALTNHLHTEHNWRNIGVAEYMTGDATGLALAPLVDPNVSLEVLTGAQKKNETRGPTFLKDGALPPYFAGAQAGGNVTFSDTDNRDDFKGTSDRYGKTFNANVNPNTMPWNKETWEATKVIGDAYASPEKRDIIRSQISLGDSSSDQATKTQIEAYKKQKLDPTVGGRACVFLWGRRSGANGGAHKELDSHGQMLIQLAQKIRADFPAAMIILVGDKVISTDDLAQAGVVNQTMELGAFWNDPEYGQYMKERNAQRHLFQLFTEQNQAVSIGMRSGSLEGMALLGMRVVFIDDLGNNAEGRMEMWSGDAAGDRGGLVRGGANAEALDGHETAHQGPMPTYKRVGTLLTLGDQVDMRAAKLRQGAALVTSLLHDKDHAGQPLCTEAGNAKGIGTLNGTFADTYDASLMAGHMPTAPIEVDGKPVPPTELARRFTDVLERFCNQVEPSYKGKPAEVKASQFGTADADIALMEAAIHKDLAGDDQGQAALAALADLRSMVDKADTPLVGDATSANAGNLFGTLLSKAKSGEALTSEDAKAFATRFKARRAGMLGKKTDATGGKMQFPRARIEQVQVAINTLQSNNVLQPDELNQVSYLTGALSKT